MCFYLSGSVFTPITGLNLSKTLLAANNIVPSPTEKAEPKLVSLHVLISQKKIVSHLLQHYHYMFLYQQSVTYAAQK